MTSESRPAGVTHVALAVLGQVRHLLWLGVAFGMGAGAWWSLAGDSSLLAPAAWFALVAVGGLAGSFTVHETGHLIALRQVSSVEQVLLERTAWRLSLLPVGPMSPRQVLGVAVAGPGASCVVGLALWAAQAPAGLHWWYLAHVVSLLPPFGDGRAAVSALRARS